jgi:anaerobic magnesium-protoporphyrin IX monomethyl ester cyclase
MTMSKKRVLLIQPPLLQGEMSVDIIQEKYWDALTKTVERIYEEKGLYRRLLRAKGNFTGFHEPNIGLLYIAGVLKQHDCDVEYYDFNLLDAKIRNEQHRPISVSDIEHTLSQVRLEDLTMVGISPITVNFGWAMKIAGVLKRLNRNVVVVVGGVHVSFEYMSVLRDYNEVDVVVIGEGEETIVELAECLCQHNMQTANLEHIKGIAYRHDTDMLFTGERKRITDLDRLPYPLYELLPREYTENAILRVLTSRGCRNNCAFCVPSKMFREVVFRDPIRVVDEIQHLMREFGCRTFMVGDLNFLNHYEYSAAFCNELIRRDLDILWMCQSRTDLIDRDVARLMYRAGCVMVCLGVESADQSVLDRSGKGITTEMNLEALRTVKDAGLKVFTYWAFGLPGETHESAQKTIRMLRELLDQGLLDYTHCTLVVPYPGTPLFTNPEKYDLRIVSKDFDRYWLSCDYLGAGLPVAETRGLSIYEIYGYWQLALATVAGNLHK